MTTEADDRPRWRQVQPKRVAVLRRWRLAMVVLAVVAIAVVPTVAFVFREPGAPNEWAFPLIGTSVLLGIVFAVAAAIIDSRCPDWRAWGLVPIRFRNSRMFM